MELTQLETKVLTCINDHPDHEVHWGPIRKSTEIHTNELNPTLDALLEKDLIQIPDRMKNHTPKSFFCLTDKGLQILTPQHTYEPCKGCGGSGSISDHDTDMLTGESIDTSITCTYCGGSGNALGDTSDE